MSIKEVLSLFYIIGNKACIFNHTLLLWKMGHVNKAIEGWAWYRELPIIEQEQCQKALQQIKRYICCHVEKVGKEIVPILLLNL